MEIKNLIFDIGNVLLKWDPEGIKKATIGNEGYREGIERFFREAPYHFYPIEETLNQALRYKKLGYKIFLLSNIHKYGYGILKERFPFFDNFDGGVISFEIFIQYML